MRAGPHRRPGTSLALSPVRQLTGAPSRYANDNEMERIAMALKQVEPAMLVDVLDNFARYAAPHIVSVENEAGDEVDA